MCSSNFRQPLQNKANELSESDLRIATEIGRRLATIGDEVNQSYPEQVQRLGSHQRRPQLYHAGLKPLVEAMARSISKCSHRSEAWIGSVCSGTPYVMWVVGIFVIIFLGMAIRIIL